MSHTCHWPGCAREVPPRMFMCRGHWYTVPADLRAGIWQHYREGQEVTKTPSRDYLEVARLIQAWCIAYDAKYLPATRSNEPDPPRTLDLF